MQVSVEESQKRHELIDQLKALNQQFEPDFVFIYSQFESACYPLAHLERLVAATSSKGPAILTSEVHAITPSYEKLCAMFPDGYGAYNEADYTEWIHGKVAQGAYYYGREKHRFFTYRAYEIAAAMGRSIIILDNLS